MSNTKKFSSPIRVGSSPTDPSDTEAGVIYFNSADDVLKFRDSTVYKTVLGAVSDDTSPELGGNLDVSGFNIIGASSDVTVAGVKSFKRAKFASPTDAIEEEYIHSISLNASMTDEIITEFTFDPVLYEACEIVYRLKDSLGAIRLGTLLVVTNGTDISMSDGPSVETANVDVSFNSELQTVGETFAEFEGQVAGMTTDVTITADNIGTVGNSVALNFDGLTDIDTAIANWNIANPSNTVTLTAGNGSQIPDNLEVIQLIGGDDGEFLATVTFTSGAENSVLRADIKRIKA